jgi:hypothetical protein
MQNTPQNQVQLSCHKMNPQRSFERDYSVHNGFLMNQKSMTLEAESIKPFALAGGPFSGAFAT